MLPDEPGTKVNQCVENIMQIWRDGEACLLYTSTEAQKFREDRRRCYRVLSDYYYLLKKWEIDNSPRKPEEEPHPRFVEAIQKKTYVEYLLDLFLYESEEDVYKRQPPLLLSVVPLTKNSKP